MRLALHVAMILLLGVGMGFAVRAMRSSSDEPGPDDIVYTNATPEDIAKGPIETGEPTRPPEGWLSEFTLTERSGETVSSEDLLGQQYIVSFFFSTCPSICVQQNQKLQELQTEFAGKRIRFVAISVDPETDTPERLREYAARFGADKEQWLFMTGDLTYIRRVGAEIFSQPVNKQFHTERFCLVDAKGKIEGFYNWPEAKQMDKLKETIEEMISQL